MRKVYAVGESLLDVISKNSNMITEKPGGSMLNAAVSIAKIKISTFLISEIGIDKEGEIIESFLASVGVDDSFIFKFSDGNTAIARATLDERNNATYTFEKKYPIQRLKINIPKFTIDDILLFGSIYSIENEIEGVLNRIISAAQKSSALILYDPNIRKSNLNRGDENKIIRNINSANIIRASNEDFKNVFGANNFEDACLCISKLSSKIFVYTCAEAGVYLSTPHFKVFFEIPNIEPVSTIGAGDSFNAGLIHAFYLHNIDRQSILDIKENVWEKIIQHAIRFSTEVCMSYDNYISEEFAKKILSEI